MRHTIPRLVLTAWTLALLVPLPVSPCNGRMCMSIVVPVHVKPEPCDMRAVRSFESL